MDIAERPYALLAELTYRCPLHCPYCSNPVQAADKRELNIEQWKRVIREAAALGVLQIGFSGVEPLQRKDLEALVQVARETGLYTNLITSGIGLSESRARQLADSGLDNFQLSFQAAEAELADRIAGVRNAHDQKLRAARLIQESGVALSLNVVLHRFNIDRLGQISAYVVTALLPVIIPSEGSAGHLVMAPNRRPVRSSYLFNLVDKIILDNPATQFSLRFAFRSGLLKLKQVRMAPGNLYLFWGYRSVHANEARDPEKIRATALFHFGDPHVDSGLRRFTGRAKSRSRVLTDGQ